ncbi:hypothetical protein AB0N09_40530 [Streptomyces erythrochromogenes]|uniref:hypothetical protein n=1 Tax=Streptomyces erythrochromogenes TaxID=285574 RepID=UPI003431FF0F
MSRKNRETIVLRAKSWKLLSVTLPPALGVFGTIAVLKGLEAGGARDFWFVVATLLALGAFIQRILSARVLLDSNTLTIMNPVFTYSCAREYVRWPAIRDDGGLEIHLRDGRVVAAFAFGGSLISRAMGTGPKVVGEISTWLKASNGELGGGDLVLRREWTRTPFAELILALAALSAAIGTILHAAS